MRSACLSDFRAHLSVASGRSELLAQPGPCHCPPPCHSRRLSDLCHPWPSAPATCHTRQPYRRERNGQSFSSARLHPPAPCLHVAILVVRGRAELLLGTPRLSQTGSSTPPLPQLQMSFECLTAIHSRPWPVRPPVKSQKYLRSEFRSS